MENGNTVSVIAVALHAYALKLLIAHAVYKEVLDKILMEQLNVKDAGYVNWYHVFMDALEEDK